MSDNFNCFLTIFYNLFYHIFVVYVHSFAATEIQYRQKLRNVFPNISWEQSRINWLMKHHIPKHKTIVNPLQELFQFPIENEAPAIFWTNSNSTLRNNPAYAAFSFSCLEWLGQIFSEHFSTSEPLYTKKIWLCLMQRIFQCYCSILRWLHLSYKHIQIVPSAVFCKLFCHGKWAFSSRNFRILLVPSTSILDIAFKSGMLMNRFFISTWLHSRAYTYS